MARAIAEDLLPLGDLTAALVPADAVATVRIVSRAAGVIAGRACALETFLQIDPSLRADLAGWATAARWTRGTWWRW